MNFLKLREELGISYNRTINEYLDVFETRINDRKIGPIRDYADVDVATEKLIRNKATEIINYEQDYYAWKSIDYIAKKFYLEPEIVINYLKEIRSNLDTSNQGDKNILRLNGDEIYIHSEVRKMSSYMIYKSICMKKISRIINE